MELRVTLQNHSLVGVLEEHQQGVNQRHRELVVCQAIQKGKLMLNHTGKRR